jgi:hypothetical protein
MQGRVVRHLARSRQGLLALSVLTFAVAMLAVQVRSTVAASVSSFKVDNLIGSKGAGAKKKDPHMINPWGSYIHRRR